MKFAKSRTAIGIVAVGISLVIAFIALPTFTKLTSSKIEIVRFKTEVRAGDVITSDMVELKEVGRYNIPNTVLTDIDKVIGKYASIAVKPEMYVLNTMVTDENTSKEIIFSALDGEKVAISIPSSSLASNVSNNIEQGDIISLLTKNGGTNNEKFYIHPALRFMQVITTSAESGQDIENGTATNNGENEDAGISTITVLATPDQAELIADAGEGVISTLVCKKGSDIAKTSIAKQEKFLKTWDKNDKNTENTDKTDEKDDKEPAISDEMRGDIEDAKGIIAK